MIKFSKEKVKLLHKMIAQETGGSIGIRDEGLLESALEAAFSGFGGAEFYPTKEEKGARLGYNLIYGWSRGKKKNSKLHIEVLECSTSTSHLP